MIKVNNINGLPESTPTDYVARHSDGTYFYFFETKEEWEEFFSSLPKVWSKEAYCNEINTAHNELFTQLYTERDYLSIGEISLWLSDETYGQEATDLINWWRLTCNLVSAYLEAVTEETQINDFLTTLPPF